MASEPDQDVPSAPTGQRIGCWAALATLLVLAAGLAILWGNRQRIADNYIASELAERGIAATYEVEQIGGRLTPRRIPHGATGIDANVHVALQLNSLRFAMLSLGEANRGSEQKSTLALRANVVQSLGRNQERLLSAVGSRIGAHPEAAQRAPN